MVIFEPKSNDFKAIISPSTKALRSELKRHRVEFTLPFDVKNKVPYYDSLEPDQIGQINKEKHEQSSISQVVVQGEQNIVQLLQILVEKFNREFLKLSFSAPKILSSFDFDYATCERLVPKAHGNLTKTVGLETKTHFRIEFEGIIIPKIVQKLYECIRKNCTPEEDERVEIVISTVENTQLFNMPNLSNFSVADCNYLCKIILFSSGNQFLLENQ